MVEVIPLKYGVTFKRVFSEPEVFCAFVKDVLGIQVKIEKVQTEFEYPEAVGYVKIKYDLFAEYTTQRIIVEIQQIKEDDFFDRFLYYHILGLIEQAKTYKGYRFGRIVYTIVVLTSVPEDDSINFSVGEMDMSVTTEFGTRVYPYPHRLFFLSPRQVNAQTPEPVKGWLELIKDSLDSQIDETAYPSEMFQHVINTIKKHTITPDELAKIKDEEAWADTQARLKAEGIAEGLEKGIAEGLEKGIAEGLEKGIAEGLEKGVAEGLEKGAADGAARTLRHVLPMMLTMRFGQEIPIDLGVRLEQCDLAKLQQLQETMPRATSVEEWLALL